MRCRWHRTLCQHDARANCRWPYLSFDRARRMSSSIQLEVSTTLSETYCSSSSTPMLRPLSLRFRYSLKCIWGRIDRTQASHDRTPTYFLHSEIKSKLAWDVSESTEYRMPNPHTRDHLWSQKWPLLQKTNGVAYFLSQTWEAPLLARTIWPIRSKQASAEIPQTSVPKLLRNNLYSHHRSHHITGSRWSIQVPSSASTSSNKIFWPLKVWRAKRESSSLNFAMARFQRVVPLACRSTPHSTETGMRLKYCSKHRTKLSSREEVCYCDMTNTENPNPFSFSVIALWCLRFFLNSLSHLVFFNPDCHQSIPLLAVMPWQWWLVPVAGYLSLRLSMAEAEDGCLWPVQLSSSSSSVTTSLILVLQWLCAHWNNTDRYRIYGISRSSWPSRTAQRSVYCLAVSYVSNFVLLLPYPLARSSDVYRPYAVSEFQISHRLPCWIYHLRCSWLYYGTQPPLPAYLVGSRSLQEGTDLVRGVQNSSWGVVWCLVS